MVFILLCIGLHHTFYVVTNEGKYTTRQVNTKVAIGAYNIGSHVKRSTSLKKITKSCTHTLSRPMVRRPRYLSQPLPPRIKKKIHVTSSPLGCHTPGKANRSSYDSHALVYE